MGGVRLRRAGGVGRAHGGAPLGRGRVRLVSGQLAAGAVAWDAGVRLKAAGVRPVGARRAHLAHLGGVRG